MTRMNQDSKPKILMPSWLILVREKAIVLVFIFAIIWFLTYILPGPFSRTLVKLGNAAFSAGNENFGVTSYYLSRFFNSDLKQSVDQCYAYNAQKQYELAIDYCNKAIEFDSNYAQAYFYRGNVYVNLKEYDQAIADFTRDIELISVATRSYINRGNVYREQYQYDLAIADFTKSIEINPNEPQAYLNRGLTYIQQGQSDLAILDCNKAIELSENYWNAYSCLGFAFTDQEKYELAIDNFNKAIELAPSTMASSIYCWQGATYTKFSDFESAINSLEQGINLDVTNENDWCISALENARQGILTP